MKKKIIVFSGHSGGHLFPALAFAESLRRKLPELELRLVTSRKAKSLIENFPPQIFDAVDFFPDFPFPAGFSLRSVFFLFQIARVFVMASQYLSKRKPDLCVGFGSYVSYPGMMLAAARKIPTIIHEQNLIPGKATQWLAGHVDCVAVSFEETFRNEKLKRREVLGLPLRLEIRESAAQCAQKGPATEESRFHLLIFGGSQGAKRINQVILEAFSQLSSEEKEKMAVTHITGKQDFSRVLSAYRTLNLSSEVYSFSKNIFELLGKADAAITRAGANSLFELALFQIPAIVIPYPYAGAHQAANAEYFRARNAVVTKPEKELNAAWLLEQIRRLMKDRPFRLQLSENIAHLAAPNAAEKLAELAAANLWKERAWELSLTT